MGRGHTLHFSERASIAARMGVEEHGLILRCRWFLERWDTIDEDISSAVLRANPRRYGRPKRDDLGYNAVVDGGETLALQLLVASGGTALNNANARIGVGDSNAAFADTHTDLQAASNKAYLAMNATYPTAPASGSTTFQADANASTALYAWNEFGLFNGNPGTMFSRKVQSFGTHAAGVWTISVVLSAD